MNMFHQVIATSLVLIIFILLLLKLFYNMFKLSCGFFIKLCISIYLVFIGVFLAVLSDADR